MVGGQLREVARVGTHRLVSDGWKYYDQRTGDPRHKPRLVGYFENDRQAIERWLDMLEAGR